MKILKSALIAVILSFIFAAPFQRAGGAETLPLQLDDGSLATAHRDPSRLRIDFSLTDPQSDRSRTAPFLIRRSQAGNIAVTPESLLKPLEGKTAQYDQLDPNITEVIRTSQWFRQESTDGRGESIPVFFVDWPAPCVLLFVQTNVSDQYRYLHVFRVDLSNGKITHLLTEGFNGIKNLHLSPNGKRLSFTEYAAVSGGRIEAQSDQRTVTIPLHP